MTQENKVNLDQLDKEIDEESQKTVEEKQAYYDEHIKPLIDKAMDLSKAGGIYAVTLFELGKAERKISEEESREGVHLLSSARMGSNMSNVMKSVALILDVDIPREVVGVAIASGRVETAYLLHLLTTKLGRDKDGN